MSIVQIMDSTKSGRLIYLVASATIIVGTAVGLVYGFGGLIILEASVGLVPIVGLFSLLLWILKPDRFVVERYAVNKIYAKDELKQVKIRMASSLIYIKPWESSQKEAYSIQESLRNDVDRILQSSEFKEQIDNYKQAFWFILLTPFTFILMLVFFQIPPILLMYGRAILVLILGLVGLGIGAFFAVLMLRENRETPSRIIEYVFARWFHEGASTDLSRRETGFGRKSDIKDQLSAVIDIVTPTIDMVIRGDWKGFDAKSRDLSSLISIPNPESITWGYVNEYFKFLRWVIGNIHGPYSQRIDICLKNAKLQILDSVAMLKENRKPSFNQEEELIASTLEHIVNSTGDRNTVLDMNADFYKIFNQGIFENLITQSFEILGETPFRINQQPQLSPPKEIESEKDRLAWKLVAAAEIELLDVYQVLKIIIGWEVHPTTIDKTLGKATCKIIMERDVGWNTDQIRSVLPTIASRMKHVNLDKMKHNFSAIAQKEGVGKIQALVVQLLHDVGNVQGTASIIEKLRIYQQEL